MSTQTPETPAELQISTNPFPGLRPFEFDESHLFFGREGQSEQLIGKLSRTHFLAVVGTSGSGKSSLVRAGFLPALQGGFMTSAGSGWRVAIMRPGNDPIGNLARALNAPDVFGSELEENAAIQVAIAESTLRRGSLGLVDTARQSVMSEDENLLVVVDQFEEIFRFARVTQGEQYGNEAAAFIKLLLEASAQHVVPIYVVFTMRSDYLGDCSQFWGLPEAINESQYLIPRLTRDQLREAITGPVAVGGGKIAPRLVNRLLNDVGDNQDQLPVLQHLLMRAWDEWKEQRLEVEIQEGQEIVKRLHRDVHRGDEIDLCCAEAVGGMADALSRHADEAHGELPNDHHREVAEKLFKALTEKGPDNREIRRPITLGEICDLTGAAKGEVITVMETFRRPGRSFLMPPVPVALNSESLVDISHESLIRGWVRLKDWVEEEARSSRIYRRLAETAVLHQEGGAGLWRDPDLQIALTWRELGKPNEVWARRYHPEFTLAQDFLDQSVTARDAQKIAEEAQRRKEIKRSRLTALIFGVAFLFSAAMGVYAYGAKNNADAERVKADLAKDDALAQKKEAVKAKDDALAQKIVADNAKDDAYTQKGLADKAKNDALAQQEAAEDAKNDALEQKKVADTERAKADRAKNEALKQSALATAEALKGRAISALKEGEPGEALTHFTKLSEIYRDMKDPSGESYAFANIAEIHKDRVPFAALGADFGFDAEALEDAEGDPRAYAAAIKNYSKMMTMGMALQALQLEGKDEKTVLEQLSKDVEHAFAYYNQALAANKRNTKPDQSFREAGILKDLGDLQVGRGALNFEIEPKDADKKAAQKEAERHFASGIQYYLEARAAYGKAERPLEEAGVLTRIADLIGKMRSKTDTSNPGDQTQAAAPQQTDRREKAAELERIVGFYEEASDAFRRGSAPLKQASVLLRIGDIYKGLPKEYYAKERSAIPYYERAREIYRTEKNFRKEGSTSETLAQLYGELLDDKEEIAFYKEAFAAYLKAGAVERKQPNDLFAKAAEMLKTVGEKSSGKEDAKQFFEEAISRRGNDSASKAQTLSVIGDFYKDKDDVAEALKYYGRKRETWRQAGNFLEEGNTLVEIGSLHHDSQNVAAAIEVLDEARRAFHQVDSRADDEAGILIRSKLTPSLMKIASIYQAQDKQKAIATYEEALRIETLPSNKYSSFVPQILEQEGGILLAMKTNEAKLKAEQLFQKVLEFNRSRKVTDGEANALASIGDMYKTVGDKVEARAYFERARLAYPAGKSSYPYQLVAVLKKIGELEAEGNPGKTERDYYLSLADSAGLARDMYTQGVVLEMLGDSYRSAQDKEKAIEFYGRARLAYQAGGQRDKEIFAIRSIADQHQAMGNKQKAKELRKQADDLARTPR